VGKVLWAVSPHLGLSNYSDSFKRYVIDPDEEEYAIVLRIGVVFGGLKYVPTVLKCAYSLKMCLQSTLGAYILL
jgi:hypothetical protein